MALDERVANLEHDAAPLWIVSAFDPVCGGRAFRRSPLRRAVDHGQSHALPQVAFLRIDGQVASFADNARKACCAKPLDAFAPFDPDGQRLRQFRHGLEAIVLDFLERLDGHLCGLDDGRELATVCLVGDHVGSHLADFGIGLFVAVLGPSKVCADECAKGQVGALALHHGELALAVEVPDFCNHCRVNLHFGSPVGWKRLASSLWPCRHAMNGLRFRLVTVTWHERSSLSGKF